MQAILVNPDSPNTNLPRSADTDRQRRIIAASPSVWLTPDRKYFEIDGGGKVSGWYDALNNRRFVPAGAVPPAFTAIAGGALGYLDFVGAAGQALVDSRGVDLLPASGTPMTIVTLTRQTAAAGSFGGGVMGSRAASNPLIFYTDSSNTIMGFQTQTGIAGQSTNGAAAENDAAWHVHVARIVGSGPGGSQRRDGAANGPASTATLTLSADPNARKVAIGGYGPNGATNPLKGRVAGLMILPVDLGDPANAGLLADVEGEFATFRTMLAA